MTRGYAARYIARHPIRWLRAWLFHWIVAAALIVAGIAKRHEVFDVTFAAGWWPALVIAAGVAAGLSSLGPLQRWVQAPTGALLAGVGILRALTMAEIILRADVPPGARAVATVLAAHWVIVAAVGFRWDRLTMHAARTMLRDAALDDRQRVRGRRAAAGG